MTEKLRQLYIAGHYADRDRLWRMGNILEERYGILNTSSWLQGTSAEAEGAAVAKAAALDDIEDMARAEGIILDTTSMDSKGGREVEWGYALAHGARLQQAYGRHPSGAPRYVMIRIGPARNIFHHICNHAFPTWDELFLCLEDTIGRTPESHPFKWPAKQPDTLPANWMQDFADILFGPQRGQNQQAG